MKPAIGVFVCDCKGLVSDHVDTARVAAEAARLDGVAFVDRRDFLCSDADLGAAAPRLVVIGQRGWECENVVDMLDRCEPLRGVVIEHSGCSDEELVTYLHHAQALLFPSFAEGYGMPLVEALSLGVPVIASDLPVFEEIAGDVPEYIDPLDGRRWREVIEAYSYPGSAPRLAQRGRIERFEVPGWESHFAKVDAFIEQIRTPSSRGVR